jgi:transposase
MGKAKRPSRASRSERQHAKRERGSFSAEFKLEAVQVMRSRRAKGVSLEQIGRELDVRPNLLYRWSRQEEQRAGARPSDVFPGNGNLPSAEEEIRRLKRELEVTRAERDFLKKATVFFAKESR